MKDLSILNNVFESQKQHAIALQGSASTPGCIQNALVDGNFVHNTGDGTNAYTVGIDIENLNHATYQSKVTVTNNMVDYSWEAVFMLKKSVVPLS